MGKSKWLIAALWTTCGALWPTNSPNGLLCFLGWNGGTTPPITPPSTCRHIKFFMATRLPQSPGSTNVHAVDVALQDQDALLQLFCSNMMMAQNRMKRHADAHLIERHFEVGDWIFLKLHPYRQKSLVRCPSHKFAPRYYGPFQLAAKIGTVAYRLHLPAGCKLHPVFHVSLLKKRIGTNLRAQVTLPPTDLLGSIHLRPFPVLDMAVQ